MDWTTLKTYADWAGKLASLFADAHDAIAAGDVNQKLAAQRALNEFIDNCAAPVKSAELDDIASRAIGNIFEATLEQAMQEMGNRVAELTALTKEVNAITDQANATASALRLEKVRAVVDATAQAMDTVKTLKTQLATPQPDPQKVAASIASLVEILQTVSTQASDLGN
jgi:hypothetical protein